MIAVLDLAGADNGPHAWIGAQPPMAAVSLVPARATNYRLTPEHHGAYGSVWVYERPLRGSEPWELLLDECIRLLDESGTLVLRLLQSENLTVFAVKRFLSRNPFLQVATISESRDTSGADLFTLALAVRRCRFSSYQDRRWTVGVLTSGADAAGVVRFLASARRALADREHELVVVGPEHPDLAAFSPRYVATDVGRQHPEIGLKKNLLLEAADYDNVLISHARFELDADFFDRFDDWGYDYDFAACMQSYEDGTPYPYYSAMPLREWRWQSPLEVRDLDVLLPGQFVNGGLFVVKKHLGEIGLSSLLFHNQAEDVEFSWTLRDRGIVPRVNSLSRAVTFGVSTEHTSAFTLYTAGSGRYSAGTLADAWITNDDDDFVDAVYSALVRRPPSVAQRNDALSRLERGGSRFRFALALACTPSADTPRRLAVLAKVLRTDPVRGRIRASLLRQVRQRSTGSRTTV